MELGLVKERCMNCRYWLGSSECHRHSPARKGEYGYGAWPITHAHEWCGDWRTKVKEAA